MTERGILILSNLFYLLALAGVVGSLWRGGYRPSTIGCAMIACGVALQTAALQVRGQRIGHCPVTNLFEILIFLAWSIGLVHLVIGSQYRMSILGAFTAPVVLAIQGFALLAPIDPARVLAPGDVRVELHATFSVMSYGIFALAGVSGLVYLLQERQLKLRRPGSLLFALPPVRDLWVANQRLLFFGVILLTLGLGAGFLVGRQVAGWKLASGLVVWGIYVALLVARRWWGLSPRRVATISVIAFAVALASLWGASMAGGGAA